MHLQYRSKPQDEVSDSIGLLISILVRYPEVSTINFDPVNQELKFTFIVSRVLDSEEMVNFKYKVKESIKAYAELEGLSISIINVDDHLCEDFTKFEVTRDVGSLTQEEIALVIQLVQMKFASNLITERNENVLEEDLIMQEELIEHMLENFKTSSAENNLIAFREEGRVLVFNK